MKVFLSSPYSSHMAWPDRWEPIADAFMAMRRLRPLKIVYHWTDVAKTDNCVWSPLIQGDMIRAMLAAEGKDWPEPRPLQWCLWVLEHAGFTHNAQTLTIPRRFYDRRNGMDVERDRAKALGKIVCTDIDLAEALR